MLVQGKESYGTAATCTPVLLGACWSQTIDTKEHKKYGCSGSSLAAPNDFVQAAQ